MRITTAWVLGGEGGGPRLIAAHGDETEKPPGDYAYHVRAARRQHDVREMVLVVGDRKIASLFEVPVEFPEVER